MALQNLCYCECQCVYYVLYISTVSNTEWMDRDMSAKCCYVYLKYFCVYIISVVNVNLDKAEMTMN